MALKAMLRYSSHSQSHSQPQSPPLAPQHSSLTDSPDHWPLQASAQSSTLSGLSLPYRHSGQGSKRPPLNLGLHSGAAHGNLGLVKFALDNGQSIDSVLNGVLPIHAACCSNVNAAVVLYLIERGADVNSRRYPRKYSGERAVGSHTVGTTGSTPLHFAAANGCLAIVEILLRHGAIADLTDKYGTSPLAVAQARNHVEVASLLHQHSCMQRGIQTIMPDFSTDDTRDPIASSTRDLFTSPRNSSDFNRRVSTAVAIMTPSTMRNRNSGESTRPQSPQSPQSPQPSQPSSVNTAAAPTASSPSPRLLSQRRVSLPCIIESPTSPIIPSTGMMRQSCDIERSTIMLDREPIHPRSGSDSKIESNSANRTATMGPNFTASPRRGSPNQAPSARVRSASASQSATTSKSLSTTPVGVERSFLPAGRRSMEASHSLMGIATSNRERSIELTREDLTSEKILHEEEEEGEEERWDRQAKAQRLQTEKLGMTASRSASALSSPHLAPTASLQRSQLLLPIPWSSSGAVIEGAMMRTVSVKPRRSSDASTAETVVSSGQSSCSTLASPVGLGPVTATGATDMRIKPLETILQDEQESSPELRRPWRTSPLLEVKDDELEQNLTSEVLLEKTVVMSRSISQPPLHQLYQPFLQPQQNSLQERLQYPMDATTMSSSAPSSDQIESNTGSMSRRIKSASEPGPRQSFDVRAIFARSPGNSRSSSPVTPGALNQAGGRVFGQYTGDERKLRRRSVQGPFPMFLKGLGPALMPSSMSSNASPSSSSTSLGKEEEKDVRSETTSPRRLTTSATVASLALRDHQGHGGAKRRHHASFSGSATVSGRFARFWTSSTPTSPASSSVSNGAQLMSGSYDQGTALDNYEDGSEGRRRASMELWRSNGVEGGTPTTTTTGGRRASMMSRWSEFWSRR